MFKFLLQLVKPAICAYLLITSGHGAELSPTTYEEPEEIATFPSEPCTMITPPPSYIPCPPITNEVELVGIDNDVDSNDGSGNS